MLRLSPYHQLYPYIIGTLVLLLSACGPVNAPFVALAPATTTSVPTVAPSASLSPTVTNTPTTPPTPTASSTPTLTPTPSPTFIPLTPLPTLSPLSQDDREALFGEVWQLVRDQYVYEDYRGLDWEAVRQEFEPRVVAASTPEAFYLLMQELIDRLGDDHSVFETPQDVAQEAARFDGNLNYVGIGAMIRTTPEGGFITRLAEDGPAEQAGLQPGDLVIAIDGTPFTDTEAFGLGGRIAAVRGAPGTTVRLTIRSADGTERVVEVVRRPVGSNAFPEIEAQRLPGTEVALLRIDTFYLDNVDEEVRSALEAVTPGTPLKGLIIDVRNNGGGRVDLMLNTVGLFADGGFIGWSAGRNGKQKIVVPDGNTLPQLGSVPIIILTSEDTISAAEMFAVGMRTLAGARIVGTTTAGNTENLRNHTLSDGSRLWLAELVYLLPDGTPNEGRGVQPDRVVQTEWWRHTPENDPQIKAALDELHIP